MDEQEEQVIEQQAAPASEPEAPQFMTKAEAEQWKAQVIKEAEEAGRRAGQSWIDKDRAKEKARREAAQAQADAMFEEVKADYSAEDQPAVRDRLLRKALAAAHEPDEPAAPRLSEAEMRDLTETLEDIGLDVNDAEVREKLNPSLFPGKREWRKAAVKLAEAKRHNPNRTETPAKQPVAIDMGARGASSPAASNTLRAQFIAARDRGDFTEARRLSGEMAKTASKSP